MTEIEVRQRSEEWFELRACVCLTASRFGEALGVGRGKPGDFLKSLLYEQEDLSGESLRNTHHGTALEPVIHEAYQLLTGNSTREAGFWVPDQDSALHGLVGASPDAVVLDGGRPVGLAEFKAPVYKMYDSIPRAHMVQVQGQMALASVTWCDHVAVCTRTREISLKRVHFAPAYWKHVQERLKTFCEVLKEARDRMSRGLDPMSFPEAASIVNQPITGDFLPGEEPIRVENLLQTNPEAELYRSGQRMWMTFDLVMGMNDPDLTSTLRSEILKKIDSEMQKCDLSCVR